MSGIAILGSTGSIGASTLDVVARHPQRYRVVALAARHSVERMAEQCRHFEPEYAVMADPDAAERLERELAVRAPCVKVLAGEEGLRDVVRLPEVQQVVAAVVGAAGLPATLEAARAGKRILLANKESLVISGDLLISEVRRSGAELLPIDSEHNAIFQCMPADFADGLGERGVRRILITASGGPFRNTPQAELESVTPAQACAHPNWAMGRKISVDSATMMNKGLEVIEACWLFHTTPDYVEVLLHPQSIIHSLVEYVDGSVLAQLGNPDMRTPIAHALAWPERIDSGVEPLDLFRVGRLDFEPPDLQRFPCLGLAYQAIRQGGTTPAILNAANEVAVAAFLDGRLRFTGIPRLIERVLGEVPANAPDDLETILADDRRARRVAEQLVAAA